MLRQGPQHANGHRYNTLKQALDDGAVVMAYGSVAIPIPISAPRPHSGFSSAHLVVAEHCADRSGDSQLLPGQNAQPARRWVGVVFYCECICVGIEGFDYPSYGQVQVLQEKYQRQGECFCGVCFARGGADGSLPGAAVCQLYELAGRAGELRDANVAGA